MFSAEMSGRYMKLMNSWASLLFGLLFVMAKQSNVTVPPSFGMMNLMVGFSMETWIMSPL